MSQQLLLKRFLNQSESALSVSLANTLTALTLSGVPVVDTTPLEVLNPSGQWPRSLPLIFAHVKFTVRARTYCRLLAIEQDSSNFEIHVSGERRRREVEMETGVRVVTAGTLTLQHVQEEERLPDEQVLPDICLSSIVPRVWPRAEAREVSDKLPDSAPGTGITLRIPMPDFRHM